MTISVDSLLLGLIREAWAEGVQKEKWKQERIRGEIDRFVRECLGLLTRCGWFWVIVSGGIKRIVIEEVHNSHFSLRPRATNMY